MSETEDLLERYFDAVRAVRNGSGTGTCFLIHRDAEFLYFATCAHNISSDRELPTVVGGLDGPVEVVFCGAQDGPDDMAVLRAAVGQNTRETLPEPIPLGTGVGLDGKVVLLAKEGWGSHQLTLSKAMQAAYSKIDDPASGTTVRTWVLRYNPEERILRGNSGGAVLNGEGRAVGIVTSRQDGMQRGIAVMVSELARCWPDFPEWLLTADNSATEAERLLATRYLPQKPHQTTAYFCGERHVRHGSCAYQRARRRMRDRLRHGEEFDRPFVDDRDDLHFPFLVTSTDGPVRGPSYEPVKFAQRGGFGGAEPRSAEAVVKAAWQDDDPANLVAFVAPFPADVRETLLGLGVYAMEGERYDEAFAFRSTYWCDVASILLFASEKQQNPRAALAYGIASNPADAELVAAITSAMDDWKDVLILVDLSEVDIDSLLEESAARDTMLRLFMSLRQLLGISSWRGKARIVLGVPKSFQAAGLGADRLEDLWPDAVYQAVEPGLSDAAPRHGHRPFVEPAQAFQARNLRQLLLPFGQFNSNALRQSVEKFLEGRPPESLERIRTEEVLEAAAHFLRDGFLEVAYRLELFCRTDAYVEPPITLSAVIAEKAEYDIEGVSAGYVRDARLLPMIHSRFFLFGRSGTGKSEVLGQIERAYAVPQTERPGKLHAYWLPMLFGPSEFERLDLSQMLGSKASFVPRGSPMNPIPLKAHRRLARFAELADVDCFFASPLLLLVDDGQRFDWSNEDANRQVALLQRCALVMAWNEQTALHDLGRVAALPFASGAGGAELEGLRFADALALFAAHGGKADLTRFQFAIDQPIHAMLSRPFLVACLAVLEPAVLESGERLTLFRVLKAFVDCKSPSGSAEDFQILIENTLPKAAYERRISSDLGVLKDPDARLARRAGLIKDDQDRLAFRDSLLDDYFVALEMRRRLSQGGEAEDGSVFGAIFSRTSSESWPLLYGDLIRLLCGGLDAGTISRLMRFLEDHDNRLLAHLGLLELDEAAYGAVPESGRIAEALAEVAADPESSPALQAALTLSYYDPRIAAPSEFLASLCRIGEREAMAPHPVTNLEFSRFVNDGGYACSDYWLEGGWLWKEESGVHGPAFWSSNDFSHPNQPVVGVSFYEAKAYCNWLSVQLGEGAGPRVGIDLPRVLDWDRASGALRQWPQLVQWAQDVLRAEESDRGFDVAEFVTAESGKQGGWPAKPVATLRAPPPIGVGQPNELGLFGMRDSVWSWCNEQLGGGRIDDVMLVSAVATDRVTAIVKGGSANAVHPLTGGGLDLTARLHVVGLRIVAVAREGQWGAWG